MTVLILNQNHLGDQVGKRCTKCKETKLINDFPKDISTKDGLCPWCKDCDSIRKRQYYQSHKIESMLYRQSHKAEIAARGKRYNQEHKKERAVKQKQHRLGNKVERMEYAKQYQQTVQGKSAIKRGNERYRQTEKGRIAKRKGDHKRRALKYGNIYEVFDSKEIFERDNYICQLCGKKTRPDYKNPNHPLYPNLDHIIPLSKGGEHTRKNTQCSCRQCNIEKNNKIIGQLRMFG